MKTNLKNRPSHRGFAFGDDPDKDFGYARDCILWFEAFEAELRKLRDFTKKTDSADSYDYGVLRVIDEVLGEEQ